MADKTLGHTDYVPVFTECCKRQINGLTDRYCPSCGWECRIESLTDEERADGR